MGAGQHIRTKSVCHFRRHADAKTTAIAIATSKRAKSDSFFVTNIEASPMHKQTMYAKITISIWDCFGVRLVVPREMGQ